MNVSDRILDPLMLTSKNCFFFTFHCFVCSLNEIISAFKEVLQMNSFLI